MTRYDRLRRMYAEAREQYLAAEEDCAAFLGELAARLPAYYGAPPEAVAYFCVTEGYPDGVRDDPLLAVDPHPDAGWELGIAITMTSPGDEHQDTVLLAVTAWPDGARLLARFRPDDPPTPVAVGDDAPCARVLDAIAAAIEAFYQDARLGFPTEGHTIRTLADDLRPDCEGWDLRSPARLGPPGGTCHHDLLDD